ncbi:S-formylglutathione hydrolase [Enterococcus sp. AZ103]
MENKQIGLKILEQHQSFGGQQIKYSHESTILQCKMTFSLFIPKKAEEQKAVPLIWFLAGLTCTDDNFSQKSGFQKYASENGVAFVMPDTSPRKIEEDSPDWDLGQGASFYLNATKEPWKRHYQMYDYLTKELPEIVYNLVPNFSGQESIMGHSMGGHGALVIGLKNPERFQAISAFAPISNPMNVPWGQKAFENYLGSDQSNWENWDAAKLVEKTGFKNSPILITQGSKDNFYEIQLNEAAFLAGAKKSHTCVTYQIEKEYDHSYFMIATFIEEHIKHHVNIIK